MDNGPILPAAEEWKPVVGFEDSYSVSSYGRIRRIKTAQGSKGLRILHPPVGKIGYRMIYLGTGSAKTRELQYVHRIVAAAFLGTIPKGMTVNHIDFDRTNNHVTNLEIVSQADNIRHNVRHWHHAHGSSSGKAKLDEAKVVEIRRLRGTMTTRALGKKFGVGGGIISMIHTRRIWKHVA